MAGLNSPVPNLAYSNQVCFNCYRSPPQTSKLSKCSSCKRVKYCSTACSKEDWSSHKSFCRSFEALRSRPLALLPPLHPTVEGISNRRQTQQSQYFLESDLLESALNRTPSKLENLLLYRENRCWVCWDREGEALERGVEWKACKGCGIAHFCGDHEESGKGKHKETRGSDGRSQCQLYNLSNEILEFHLRHTSSTNLPPSLFIPPRILTSPQPLPSNWIDYFLSVQLPLPLPSNGEVFGVFAESLSPVLTILSSLSKLGVNPNKEGELRIEILGATVPYEGSFLPAFEELLHQLPNLKSLSLCFIGNEVPLTLEATHTETFLSTCPTCTQADRKVGFEWRSGLYHELVEQKELKEKVDLVVCFSSGIGMEDWDESSQWKPTLEGLLRRKLPILMVANTKEEAKEDLKVLTTLAKGKLVYELERNIFCGGDVNIDVFEEEGYWRRNEWIFGILGVSEV